MAKWQLCRRNYPKDIYEFKEGEEVTIGRDDQNTIKLRSLKISRKHCVIHAKSDEVLITDLQSVNGIYVGLKKISPNKPYSLSSNDIIGLGWTEGAQLEGIDEAEKFVFVLLKISDQPSIVDSIKFEMEPTDIETELAILDSSIKSLSPKCLSLKRKSITNNGSDLESSNNVSVNKASNVSIRSSTESKENVVKKFKPNFEFENDNKETHVKVENEDIKYEAFNIKQEFFDDEPQIVDSDSDSEQWYIRLSQNSPSRSFTNFTENRTSKDCQQDSSYSQLDDDVIFVGTEIKRNESDEEQFVDDLIIILPPPVDLIDSKSNVKDIPTLHDSYQKTNNKELTVASNILKDNVIGVNTEQVAICGNNIKEPDKLLIESVIPSVHGASKKAQLIGHIPQSNKKHGLSPKIKNKKKYERKSLKPCIKLQLTNSQKEDRKKKLRAIASKPKGEDNLLNNSICKNDDASAASIKVNAKVTTSNRGAFLTEDPVTSKPAKRKKALQENKSTKSMEHVNKKSNSIEVDISLNSEIKKTTSILNLEGERETKTANTIETITSITDVDIHNNLNNRRISINSPLNSETKHQKQLVLNIEGSRQNTIKHNEGLRNSSDEHKNVNGSLTTQKDSKAQNKCTNITKKVEKDTQKQSDNCSKVVKNSKTTSRNETKNMNSKGSNESKNPSTNLVQDNQTHDILGKSCNNDTNLLQERHQNLHTRRIV